MAKRRPPEYIISCFLLAALALGAFLDALVPVPAAMAAPTTSEVEGWYQALEKDEVLEKSFHMAIHVMHEYMEKLASLGDGNGESGGTAQADAIRSIGTGIRTFSVAAVDITAPLMWTTRCDTGAGRPVPCSSPACARMAATDQPLCRVSSPIPPPCAYGPSTVLYEAGHPITMVVSSGSVVYRSQAQVYYACLNQAVGAPSTSMAAVLGLGWRGAQSLGLGSQGFSYSVDSKRRISVSVGGRAVVAAAARRGSSTGTAALLSSPNKYPDLHYVSVTGINVGGDEVPFPAGALDLRHDGSGGGVFLSTTMPLTLLEKTVYRSLVEKLKAQLPQNSITRSHMSTDQLCYRSGTRTPPTITLVLDGGRVSPEISQFQDVNRKNY